jgi:hypothetical protein
MDTIEEREGNRMAQRRQRTFGGRFVIGMAMALGLAVLSPWHGAAGTEGGDPDGIDIVYVRIVTQVCTELDEEHPENPCVDTSDALNGQEISYTISTISSGDGSPGEYTTSLIVGADGQGEITFEAGLFVRHFTVCEDVPAGVTEIAFGADLTPIETSAETGCITFDPEDIFDNNWVSVTFFNVVGDGPPPDPVDELPDTGVGLAASPSPGAWVPVLLAGALLLTVVGSRSRSWTDG